MNCLLLRISKAPRLAGLLVLTGIATTSCSLLEPRVQENDDGLGHSIIAQFLIDKSLWNMTEAEIARGMKGILAGSVSREGDARSAVESVGMRCDTIPSTTCSYGGIAIYRFFNVPSRSPAWGKKTVITIYIELPSYRDLKTFIVRKQAIEVADE